MLEEMYMASGKTTSNWRVERWTWVFTRKEKKNNRFWKRQIFL